MRSLTAFALGSALLLSPAAAAEKAGERPADAATESIRPLDDLLALELAKDEDYRLVELSATLFYAQFASGETRRAVFEGIARERLAALATSLTLTLPRQLLTAAYADAETLGGVAAAFRDDLSQAGFLAPPDGGLERALLTMIQSTDPGEIYDFSFSKTVQEPLERKDRLDRTEGDTAAESASLKFIGPDHPSVALYEGWHFDDLPDLVDERHEREAEQERLLRVRRARLAAEMIRALYYVDPSYETAVVDWIQNDLKQADVNLVAQLLQLAGYREMSPQVLVAESAPHLFDSSVLVARMVQTLERVTVQGKRRGYRRLDPAQFPDPELLQRAEAFYGRFFLGDGKGEVRPELRDEVRDFIREQSASIQRLSAPFLGRHLGSRFPAGTPSG